MSLIQVKPPETICAVVSFMPRSVSASGCLRKALSNGNSPEATPRYCQNSLTVEGRPVQRIATFSASSFATHSMVSGKKVPSEKIGIFPSRVQPAVKPAQKCLRDATESDPGGKRCQ